MWKLKFRSNTSTYKCTLTSRNTWRGNYSVCVNNTDLIQHLVKRSWTDIQDIPPPRLRNSQFALSKLFGNCPIMRDGDFWILDFFSPHLASWKWISTCLPPKSTCKTSLEKVCREMSEIQHFSIMPWVHILTPNYANMFRFAQDFLSHSNRG